MGRNRFFINFGDNERHVFFHSEIISIINDRRALLYKGIGIEHRRPFLSLGPGKKRDIITVQRSAFDCFNTTRAPVDSNLPGGTGKYPQLFDREIPLP